MSFQRLTFVSAICAITILSQVLAVSPVEAQTCTAPTCVRVGADGKGILAGGILGAEIGFIVPAILVNAGVSELDEAWSWVLFPAIGAAGGAVGGYFALEDPMNGTQRGFPEVSVAVFAVSMALIVPTFVGVLALTSYNPGNAGSNGGDEDEGAEASEPSAEAQAQRVLAGGAGLVRFADGELLLGIPLIQTQDTYTEEERAHLRLSQRADLVVPVVSGTF